MLLTSAALSERAEKLARALALRGVEPGDRVAVMLPNSEAFFVAALATAHAEAWLIPVNAHLKAEEVAWILSDSGARVLVEEDLYDSLLAEGERPGGDVDLPAGLPTPALMFYTSGTTGRPKGVVHGGEGIGPPDPARLRFVQAMLCDMWGFTTDDVYLLSGPAYHAGPGGYAFTHLFAGASVVVLPRWDAREWLRLVDRYRATTTFMTPAHFIRLLEVPEADRTMYDLSSLRLVIHGGAPCPVPVKERIIEALAPAEIYELYGASEGGATRISSKEWLDRPGSVGQPWPGTEVKVDDGGLIWIKPPGATGFRYHNDPEKTAEAWREGYFTVGDIGHIDEDGWLYITDRATDMIIRGGVNVYPREIEEVLHRHPAVVDCAVLGVPDERLGEIIKAVVEVRPGALVDSAGIQDHVREHLADFKVPHLVEFVATLPRDPNGKVLKRHL